MNHFKRFLWQFDLGTSYEGLKIGIASIIPGLGLWLSGYPKYALLAVIAFVISATVFILYPGTVLWFILCILWMAQIFLAIALEEFKAPVSPPDPAQDFPTTKKSLTLPGDLPKSKRLFAEVKQELSSLLPAHNKLISYLAGIEDKTSHYWNLGLSEDELILVSPAQ